MSENSTQAGNDVVRSGMMSVLQKFSAMVGAHAVCDYPLQGEFLAIGKNRFKPSPLIPWYQALGAHSVIHGLAVGVVTKSVCFGVSEALVHAITDDLKCKGRLSFNQDQMIHIACKFVWAALSERRS
ncbi:MAG: hypothetical protein ABF968_04900 [Acetobacter sp.]|uniref:hypothetical protein n=1 Tax=Acetobacter sp. TaxID=440 RepID=UPI0039E89D96